MTTITVSTAAQLKTALAAAKGGDTILLAAGNYGDLNLTPRDRIPVNFSSNVTIASADPNRPAVVTGLDLRGGSNITFRDITFDYTFEPDTPIHNRPFAVTGSSGIAFRGCTFDGDLASGVSTEADGYGYGIGLSINTSSGVTVDGCEFYDFFRGAVFGRITNLAVTNNDIHSLRMDGLNFGQITNARIEGNTIHDFRRSPNAGDHADMIQFWTNGATYPSTNIVIRGNHLDIGDGSPTQSIFMRNDQVDRGLAGEEMYYRNILIEDNVIVNSHAHGITVGETIGLTIRNNSVLHDDGNAPDGVDPMVNIPRINLAEDSQGVTVIRNLTAGITGWNGQSGWTLGSNLVVQDQDPHGDGYYGDVFLASTLDGDRSGLHLFRILTGSQAERNDIGAAATTDHRTIGLDVAFHVTEPADSGLNARVFDARYSTYNGQPLPAGTTYQWTFGDGTTATGAVVRHVFAQDGNYEAVLTVRLPDSRTGRADADVTIRDAVLVELGADGRFIVQDGGEETVLARVASASSDGLQLGGTGAVATVAHEYINDLFASDEFRISMTLDADVARAQGEIFRIHGSIITSVNSRGELVLRLFSDNGSSATLTSTGIRVNDMAAHDIDIVLEDGTASLLIDGHLRAQQSFAGHLREYGERSLAFGNPWGQQNFHADLTAFEMSLEADHDGAGAVEALAPASVQDTQDDVPTVVTAADSPSLNTSFRLMNFLVPML
jgi:hypothetical protein